MHSTTLTSERYPCLQPLALKPTIPFLRIQTMKWMFGLG